MMILKRLKLPHWLLVVIAIALIFRIPNLFEPFSYGDEMIYLTLGNGIRQGLVLYKDIHDNKPPLLYFLAAIAGNVFWFRAILAAWMSATIAVFYKLVENLFPKNKLLQQVSTLAFAVLTTIPMLEGNIANSELFLIGLTMLGFLILLTKKHTLVNLLFSGMLFAFAALFKMPAIFDIPAIFVLWLVLSKNTKDIGQIIKKAIFVAVGFAIPIGISFVWYASRGALQEYAVAAFLQNVGYLSSFRPGDAEKSFLVRNAPLLFRGGIVIVGIGVLTKFRKKVSKGFLFACIWLLFSLFAVALSERPYPHYLIQSVPAISLLIGILVASPRYEQVLTIIPLLLTMAVPVYYKYYNYQTFSYYQRFVQFAIGQISKEQYFDKFDGNTNRNYKIANFLLQSSTSDDRIFVWGDTSVIYALSRRLPPIKYVADYHISDFSDKDTVINQLATAKPKYIVILPNAAKFPALTYFSYYNYRLVAEVENAQIWQYTAQVTK